jgi:Fe-S cluster assembly protein SufD
MPSLSTATPPAECYSDLFGTALAELPGAGHAHLRAAREDSFARFCALGLPSARTEAWRYTPLTALARQRFALAPAHTLRRSDLHDHLIDDPGSVRLVFVNGRFASALSDPMADAGPLRITSMAAAWSTGVDTDLASLSDDVEGRSMSALNAALASDGCLIELADGAELPGPIQLLSVAVGQPASALANLRHVIRLGDRASLDLVETHLSLDGGLDLVNVTERIVLGRGARLRHDRLQLGASTGRLLVATRQELASDACLTQGVITTGGDLVRNEIDARIDGSSVNLTLNGLYLGRGRQHLDNQIRIDHRQPDSQSHQYYKGVLDERAHGVFAGQITVRRAAQKTNAYQTNANLLLSAEAEIASKPELEIFADDVKCSHGATAGELDEGELFYLRSRGLDPEAARCLLTYAFAQDVIERLANPTAIRHAQQALLGWLPGGEALRDFGRDFG